MLLLPSFHRQGSWILKGNVHKITSTNGNARMWKQVYPIPQFPFSLFPSKWLLPLIPLRNQTVSIKLISLMLLELPRIRSIIIKTIWRLEMWTATLQLILCFSEFPARLSPHSNLTPVSSLQNPQLLSSTFPPFHFFYLPHLPQSQGLASWLTCTRSHSRSLNPYAKHQFALAKRFSPSLFGL